MQSQTSDNSGFDKLKSILFLGLSCNQTTIIGCIVTWMLLNRDELGSFWANLLIVICVAPFFMGDAVNNYVLGRVRLEYQYSWEDIRMIDFMKETIYKFYKFYRAISIASSYGLVILILFKYFRNPLPDWLLPSVAIVVAINIILSVFTILKGIAPVNPSSKKQGLIYRGVFVVVALICWYCIYSNRAGAGISHLFIFSSGMLYFVICGMLHPLPTNGSLFESIIRDSILSQARAAARAKNEEAVKERLSNYSQNSQDVEDASIVESNSDMEKLSEDLANKELESDGIVPDAIIADSFSGSEKTSNSERSYISQADAEIVSVEEVNLKDKSN